MPSILLSFDSSVPKPLFSVLMFQWKTRERAPLVSLSLASHLEVEVSKGGKEMQNY